MSSSNCLCVVCKPEMLLIKESLETWEIELIAHHVLNRSIEIAADNDKVWRLVSTSKTLQNNDEWSSMMPSLKRIKTN